MSVAAALGSSGAEGSSASTAEPVATGTAEPAKAGAQGSAASEDPDFEFDTEVEEKDPTDPTKTVKKTAKQKMKQSEVKKFLASRPKLERELETTQKYRREQIEPMEAAIRAMQKDPKLLSNFAKHIGVDFGAAALEHAKREVELLKMTPEQREHLATKQELESFKQREAEQKAKAEQQQRTVAQQQQSQKLTADLISAASELKLPNDPSVMMIMTGFIRSQAMKNIAPDMRAAAEYANRIIGGGYKAMLGGLTYEQIERDHPELLTKIREGDILKMKGSQGGERRGDPATRPPRPKPAVRVHISPEEYQRRLEKGE